MESLNPPRSDYRASMIESEIMSSKNQEYIKDLLRPLINNKASIDGAIRDLVKKFSFDDNKCMTLVSINDKFSMKIGYTDYDLVFRFLVTAFDIANEDSRELHASLGVCDPLPFTKFFIDVDCKVCHQYKNNATSGLDHVAGPSNVSYMEHFAHIQKNGKLVVSKISELVNSLFGGRKIPFVVATKGNRLWCGLHIYFMVNLDVVMKQLIFNRVLLLNSTLSTHEIDITTNGILPLCRNYNAFFDETLKQIPATVDILKKISYIDVWQTVPLQYYMKPIEKSLESHLAAIDAAPDDDDAGPPSKCVRRNINDIFQLSIYNGPLLELDLYFTLKDGICFSEEETNTYDEVSKCNVIYTRIGFRQSERNFHYISLKDITGFLKHRTSNVIDSIVSLTKIDEFYQQSVPIKSINYHPTFGSVFQSEAEIDEAMFGGSSSTAPALVELPQPRLNFKKHKLCHTYDGGDNTAPLCKEYIPLTEDDVAILNKVFSDPEINPTLMSTVFGMVFKSLSMFDIVVSAVGLDIQPSAEIVAVCSSDDSALGSAGGAGAADDDSGGDARRGAGKKKKKDPLPSVAFLAEKFAPHSATIYEYFIHLVSNAMCRNHTIALLAYTKMCTDIPSKTLIKLFLNIIWDEWEDSSVENHVSIRKNFRALLSLLKCTDDFVDNMLMYSYSGCEIFYAAWRIPLDAEPRDICVTITSRVTAAGFKMTRLFKLYLIVQIFNITAVGDKMQYFDGRGRPIVESNALDSMLAFIPNVSSFVFPASKCCTIGCFSYYSSLGVVHPSLNVLERPGPFLNNKIYRNFGNHLGSDDRLTYPNQNVYWFIRDIYFKMRHYIRSVRLDTIGFILLGYVINVTVQSNLYHFQSTFKPSIPLVNVLITDLMVAYNMSWPEEFINDLRNYTKANSYFGVMWNNFLSLMLTLNKDNYIRYDPMNFIVTMFGGNEHQYQGFRKYRQLAGNRIKFNDLESQAPPESAGNDTSTLVSDTNSLSIKDNSDEPIFFQRVRNLLIQKTLDWKNNCSATLEDMSSFGSFDLITKFQQEMHRKKLNPSHFGEYFKLAKFNFESPPPIDFENIPSDFIKLSIIIFSWIIRIGDTHRYSDCLFMQKVAKHRMEIYNDFEECVLKYFHIGFINQCAQDHVNILREYCESVTLDYSNMQIPDLREIPPYTPVQRGDCSAGVYNGSLYLTETEKNDIYTAFSYLIIFSNYDIDIFTELCKIQAGLEYGGNYLKNMYMFSGKSMGGKNVYVENMRRVYNCSDKITLSNKHYGDISADNNPNCQMLGTSLLVNLDEPPEKMRPSEIKKDVNINQVTTRAIFSRDEECYQIMAKMFLTCNQWVAPTSPDDGWFRRLVLFQVNHTFCQLKDAIHRTSSQNSGQLFNESAKYLVCQVLTSCYPDHGNGSNLVTGLTMVSFILFRRMFFFRDTTPTSFAMTDTCKRQLYTYMMMYSPFFEFLNTTVIVPSEEGITSKDVNDFVKEWCSLYKKPCNYQLERAVRNFLNPYYVGNMYYVRMDMHTKDSRL